MESGSGNSTTHVLKADNRPLQQGLNAGEQAIRGYGSRVTSVMKNVGGAIAGAFAVHQLTGFIKSSVAAFGESEQAGAKLNAILNATGHAAGFTADQLKEVASNLQDVTTHEDDAIVNTMALLASFRNVRGDVFLDATEMILDMSDALGQDAKSSAIQLGKALNDPEKGITALTRVGVTFNEQQKAQIKLFLEQGKVVEAQKVILAELRAEFGGTAREMAGTFQGKLKQLNNEWGDFKEIVGESVAILATGFLPVVAGLVEELQRVAPLMHEVATATSDWGDDLFGLETDLDNATDKITTFQSVTTRMLVGIEMLWEKTFGNLAKIGYSFGEDMARTVNYLQLLITKGQLAADIYAEMSGMNEGPLKRPELSGFGDMQGEFERRVAEIEEQFRAQNKDRAERDRNRPDNNADDPEVDGKNKKAAKAKGDSSGGIESLDALFKRVQGAAAKTPEEKAIEKVEAAVKEVKEAVEALGDKEEEAAAKEEVKPPAAPDRDLAGRDFSEAIARFKRMVAEAEAAGRDTTFAKGKLAEAEANQAEAQADTTAQDNARAFNRDKQARIQQNRAAEEQRRRNHQTGRGALSLADIMSGRWMNELSPEDRVALAGGDGASASEGVPVPPTGYRTVRPDANTPTTGPGLRQPSGRTAMDGIIERNEFNVWKDQQDRRAEGYRANDIRDRYANAEAYGEASTGAKEAAARGEATQEQLGLLREQLNELKTLVTKEEQTHTKIDQTNTTIASVTKLK